MCLLPSFSATKKAIYLCQHLRIETASTLGIAGAAWVGSRGRHLVETIIELFLNQEFAKFSGTSNSRVFLEVATEYPSKLLSPAQDCEGTKC